MYLTVLNALFAGGSFFLTYEDFGENVGPFIPHLCILLLVFLSGGD